MKRRQVVWSGGARDDLLAIVDYISHDNPMNAERVLDRLEARAKSLYAFPDRGRVVPELRWHGIMHLHEIFEGPWRIIYHVDATTIMIVAIFDGRRQVNDVILERFLRLS